MVGPTAACNQWEALNKPRGRMYMWDFHSAVLPLLFACHDPAAAAGPCAHREVLVLVLRG
jgi:hypothetical protein